MRIFVSELYKLLSNRVFIICLVSAFCINGFVLIYSSNTDYDLQVKHKNSVYYNSQIEKYNNSKEPEKYLLNEMNSVSKGLMDNDQNKDELIEKMSVLSDLVSQQNYIDSYEEYINDMQSRADNQLMFSIFAEPGSFAYKNIEQTPLDFKQLKGSVLSIGNNTAVEQATQFNITDYLLLVLVVVISVFVFCFEREKGLYPLVRCTQKGRVITIVAKLFAMLVVTAVGAVIFYSSNIIIGGIYFGFGDMSRCIQSISIFMGCSLKVSIFGYLILWVLGKMITLCCIALLISLGFVVVKTTAKMYGIIVTFLGIEISANMFIEGTSAFSFFKYVNVFYLLSDNNLFGRYLNVNIFSQPVNIIIVWVVVMASFAFISSLVCIIVFAKSSQTSKKSALFSRISGFTEKRSRINGSVRIYSGEAFKHYKTSFAMVILIALAMLAVSNFYEDLSIRFSDSGESAYNTYMEDIEGKVDDKTNNYLAKEQKYFDELKFTRNKINKDKSITDNEKKSQTSYIDALLKSKGTAFERILEQKNYALKKGKEINAQPALINDLVCKRLTEDTYREWLYFTILMAAVIFCTSNIFACEYKNSMANLLRSNYYGKGRLVATKLFTVMVTSVLSFTLVYLPYLINFVITFGTKIFDIPLAFMSDFCNLTSSVTVGEFVVILGIIHLVATLTATAVVFMLSLLLKNNILTMIVSSGIILIPCLAVMEISTVRMVQAFLNNSWKIVTLLIIALCSILTSLSIAIVSVKFSKLKRRNTYAQT